MAAEETTDEAAVEASGETAAGGVKPVGEAAGGREEIMSEAN